MHDCEEDHSPKMSYPSPASMVERSDARRNGFSRADRQSFQWNQTSSRRQQIQRYPNSLSIADTRMRRCETCGKSFSSIDDMRRHISLTHTGRKPIVCQICGKRFGTTHQMMAHYNLHREPRLEEFSILKKRRQPDVVSEPSESSQTTVGTYHRVPKTLKTYKSGQFGDTNSYGTGQSYKVSHDSLSETNSNRTYLKSAKNNKLPEIKQTTKIDVKPRKDSDRESFNLPNVNKKSGIPTPDASHISTVDNVMGLTKLIETSHESHFVEDAENELIRARMEAISRATHTATPNSFRTRSGVTESRKPSHLVDREFWDSGSHVADRLTGFSPVSGYDPNAHSVLNSRGTRRTSAFSFPSIR